MINKKPRRTIEDWEETVNDAVKRTGASILLQIHADSIERCAWMMRHLQLTDFTDFDKVLLKLEKELIEEFHKETDKYKVQWIEIARSNLLKERNRLDQLSKLLPEEAEKIVARRHQSNKPLTETASQENDSKYAEEQFSNARDSISQLIPNIRNYCRPPTKLLPLFSLLGFRNISRELIAEIFEEMYFMRDYMYVVFFYNFPSPIDDVPVLIQF